MGDLKIFGVIPKNPALSDGEFHHHWLHRHGAIASRIAVFRRYIQSHRIEPPLTAIEGLNPPVVASAEHGVAEVWFMDFPSLMAMPEDPAYPELAADEPQLVDLSGRAFRVLTTERVVRDVELDSDDRGVKLLLFVRRPDGVGADDFAKTWPAAGDGDASTALGCTRHVASVAVKENYGQAQPAGGGGHAWTAADPYDGVLELWWPDEDAMVDGLASNADAVSALLASVDGGRSMSFAAREHVMIE